MNENNSIVREDNGDLRWTGECRAAAYKPIFTVCRWVVGVFGAAAVILVLVFGSEDIGKLAIYLAVTIGIILAVYFIAAGCIAALRNGRFSAEFVISEEEVTVREKLSDPETGLAIFLTVIVGIFKVIFSLMLLFSDNHNMTHHSADYDKSVVRSVKYAKIKDIVPAADGTYITLKKPLGSLRLLVAPEYCEAVTAEIKLRCQRLM